MRFDSVMSVPLGAGEQVVWSSNKNTDSVNFSQQKFYDVTVSDSYFSKETLYSAANVLLTNRRLIVSSVGSPGVHMAFELGQITTKWLTGSGTEYFNFSVNTVHGLKKYQISTPLTMISKTEAQKLNDFWQNAFAVSGSAPLPVTVVSSEAPPVQDSELQNLEKKKGLLRKKLRYKHKLKRARKYERQLDYEQALDLYRELDRVEDIRRINKNLNTCIFTMFDNSFACRFGEYAFSIILNTNHINLMQQFIKCRKQCFDILALDWHTCFIVKPKHFLWMTMLCKSNDTSFHGCWSALDTQHI